MTKPKLVTFDGEARSGKGTVVQLTKDILRDEYGHKVMLVDRGQTFRVLVVAALNAGVDIDNDSAIDDYLANEENAKYCAKLVKEVYYMSKSERNRLLYTNQVGVASAKIGARPLSQKLVADLTHKWLRDAGNEGYGVVLVDGRALENIANEMDQTGLCDYRLGLYFICDLQIGARRTLGYAKTAYKDLSLSQKAEVDELVGQMNDRNERDRKRQTEPMTRPVGAPICKLPDMSAAYALEDSCPQIIIDTGAEITKEEMAQPVAHFVAERLS